MKTSNNTILALAGGVALMVSVGALAAEEAKDKGTNANPEAKPPVTEAVTGVQNLALVLTPRNVLDNAEPHPADFGGDDGPPDPADQPDARTA